VQLYNSFEAVALLPSCSRGTSAYQGIPICQFWDISARAADSARGNLSRVFLEPGKIAVKTLALRAGFGAGQGRQQHSRQDGDNSDHDEQFD
jgi:hypothetical protein